MGKRFFIIHGWDGYPEEGWFPWLKRELEKRGFEVSVPAMPNPEEPKIEEWVNHLLSLIEEPDENTYFVGHSIGCQTIMRYLEKLENKKVGGVVFVAGWLNLTLENLSPEEKEIAKPWLETPIDFEKIGKATDKFTAIFSDNDDWVPISDREIFKKELNAEIIVERNKGHFGGDDGITELPSVLESLLKWF